MSSAALRQMPDPPSEPPRSPATYSEAFWRAMATLPAHGVPDVLATRALMTWWRVASARPPEPEVEAIRDEALRFTWSFEDVYLHLDVREDGYEWFFRVRAEGRAEGTEDVSAELTPAFFAHVAELRERHPR